MKKRTTKTYNFCSSNEYETMVRKNLKEKPYIVLSRKSTHRPALDKRSTILHIVRWCASSGVSSVLWYIHPTAPPHMSHWPPQTQMHPRDH